MIFIPLTMTQIENDDDRLFVEHIFLTYRRLFYKVAQDFVANSDADDVINISCEKMCYNIDKLKQMPSNALKAYVVTLVKNTARDHAKASNRYNASRAYASSEELESKVAYSEDVEERVLWRSLIADVRDSIGILPRREKEVMLMRFYDNLSAKEIAYQLDITENNTRGILKRARTRIINDLIEKKRIDNDEIF